MRAFEADGRGRGATAGAAAAVVALAVGLSACGAGGLHRAETAPGTRLIVRSQAKGAPVAATLDVACETPITSTGHAQIASSVLQRFETLATPGHEWTRTLDVAAGSTCTATDRPAPPAVLHAVSGGEPVTEGGRLTGVRTTIDGGATVTVDLLAGVAT
jgi:hypothetical protein